MDDIARRMPAKLLAVLVVALPLIGIAQVVLGIVTRQWYSAVIGVWMLGLAGWHLALWRRRRVIAATTPERLVGWRSSWGALPRAIRRGRVLFGVVGLAGAVAAGFLAASGAAPLSLIFLGAVVIAFVATAGLYWYERRVTADRAGGAEG